MGAPCILFSETTEQLLERPEFLSSPPIPYLDPEIGQIYFAQNGESVLICRIPCSVEHTELWKRRVLPFAAALQGQVYLHAATIQHHSTAIVFIGESGAGKSTIAKTCLQIGCFPLADDLTQIIVAQPANRAGKSEQIIFARGEQGSARVGQLFFLEKRNSTSGIRLQQLNPGEMLRQFLHHGFGELKVAKIWKTQFETYCTLAKSIPAFSLSLPEVINPLDSKVFQAALQAALQESSPSSFKQLSS